MTALACQYAGIVHRLEKVRQSHTRYGRPAWYAACPVCGDPCPTHLRLWIGESGKLHAKCYGGKCQSAGRREWWAALLTATGTTAGEWFPDGETRGRRRPRMKTAATYDYRDARGRLLFQCVKFAKPEQPDPRWRKCSYRRPAYPHDDAAKVKKDKDGSWVWDGEGLDLDKLEVGEIVPAAGSLYRLPELLAADVRQPVLIPEGEPDVEVLRALGFVSVTNPHGAGGLTYQMAIPLGGRRVVLFEDNDEAGRLRCRLGVGLLLSAGAESVRVVSFAGRSQGTTNGMDVTDYLRSLCDGMPAESYKVPAWLAANPDVAKKCRGLVAAIVKESPEFGLLTAAESESRRQKPPAEPKRLQDAMMEHSDPSAA